MSHVVAQLSATGQRDLGSARNGQQLYGWEPWDQVGPCPVEKLYRKRIHQDLIMMRE